MLFVLRIFSLLLLLLYFWLLSHCAQAKQHHTLSFLLLFPVPPSSLSFRIRLLISPPLLPEFPPPDFSLSLSRPLSLVVS